jgi:hypothetical protein
MSSFPVVITPTTTFPFPVYFRYTPLLADGVTPSGGVISGLSVTSSDATNAPAGLNPNDPNGAIVQVQAAIQPETVIVTAGPFTVTDTDGAVSTGWTAVEDLAVSGSATPPPPPPPAQLTQSIGVTVSLTPIPTTPPASTGSFKKPK